MEERKVRCRVRSYTGKVHHAHRVVREFPDGNFWTYRLDCGSHAMLPREPEVKKAVTCSHCKKAPQ